jgi:YggT family protein
MVIAILINLINSLTRVFIILIFVKVILSYFMDPYHPVRRVLDNIVEPFLAPIRRVVPYVGMFDFSPWILMILVQILASILIAILRAM